MKEKAKELVDKFLNLKNKGAKVRNLDVYQIKQCALICVDEIMKASEVFDDYRRSETEFWQGVKEEIKKL